MIPKFECRYCHKKCYFKSYLDRHEAIHSEFPTEIECEYCSNEFNRVFFRRRKGYVNHLKMAHDIFPIKKKTIDDSFTQEDIINFFKN